MVKLPVVSGKRVIKALHKIGYKSIRTTGSHTILKKQVDSGTSAITIPLHAELAKGTLLSILDEAGLTKEQLVALLK